MLSASPAPVPVSRSVFFLHSQTCPSLGFLDLLLITVLLCIFPHVQEAVELLEPLSKDPVDFVRQGALISLSMVLIQQSAAQNPTVTSVRAKFASVIGDKHEDSMAKFGAALAQGIIDAGGRNVTVSLVGRNGLKNLNAVVGMALFCQFWYWFPLAHCLSLGFAPTALIGLDKDLKVRHSLCHFSLLPMGLLADISDRPVLQIPKFDFVSKAKPSLYAYPPPTKVKEKEEAKAVATAVLSTTAKANARAQEKKKEKEGEAMDTVRPFLRLLSHYPPPSFGLTGLLPSV